MCGCHNMEVERRAQQFGAIKLMSFEWNGLSMVLKGKTKKARKPKRPYVGECGAPIEGVWKRPGRLLGCLLFRRFWDSSPGSSCGRSSDSCQLLQASSGAFLRIPNRSPRPCQSSDSCPRFSMGRAFLLGGCPLPYALSGDSSLGCGRSAWADSPTSFPASWRLSRSRESIAPLPSAGILHPARSLRIKNRCARAVTSPSTPLAYDFRFWVKILPYAVAALGAIGGAACVGAIPGLGGGLPRFGGASLCIEDLPWLVPCVVPFLWDGRVDTSFPAFSQAWHAGAVWRR